MNNIYESRGVNPLQALAKKFESFSLISNASPPEKPGSITKIEKMNDNSTTAASKWGTTLANVGVGALRVFTGAAAGTLYLAAFAIGGGISLVGLTAGALLTAPVVLAAGGMGAIEGALDDKSTAALSAEKAGTAAGKIFFGGVNTPGMLAAAAVYHTIGKVGAYGLAFAATGKFDFEEIQHNTLTGMIDSRTEKIKGKTVDVRDKTTNEKLTDLLFIASFPLLTQFTKINPYINEDFTAR